MYALRDLSMSVEKGEFVFLTGPSGAGKSTLLRLLLLQERPTEGRSIVNGRNLATLSPREVQAYRRDGRLRVPGLQADPTKTVFENVAFVLRVLGQPVEQQRRRTYQVLKWVGLQHRLNAYPLELSGGEQQRVAIARALVNEPQLVLADEPTGNLDPDLSLEIMNLFRDINASGTTVLVATHDRELIKWVGRRRDQLEHGIGRLEPARADRAVMSVVGYAFEEALASLRGRARSALMSMGTIAIAFVTLGGFLLVVGQRAATCSAVAGSRGDVGLPARHRDEATARRSSSSCARAGGGAWNTCRRTRRSSAFARTFRSLATSIVAVGDNPFPSAFEVRLRPRGGATGRRRWRARSRPRPAWPTCSSIARGSRLLGVVAGVRAWRRLWSPAS